MRKMGKRKFDMINTEGDENAGKWLSTRNKKKISPPQLRIRKRSQPLSSLPLMTLVDESSIQLNSATKQTSIEDFFKTSMRKPHFSYVKGINLQEASQDPEEKEQVYAHPDFNSSVDRGDHHNHGDALISEASLPETEITSRSILQDPARVFAPTSVRPTRDTLGDSVDLNSPGFEDRSQCKRQISKEGLSTDLNGTGEISDDSEELVLTFTAKDSAGRDTAASCSEEGSQDSLHTPPFLLEPSGIDLDEKTLSEMPRSDNRQPNRRTNSFSSQESDAMHNFYTLSKEQSSLGLTLEFNGFHVGDSDSHNSQILSHEMAVKEKSSLDLKTSNCVDRSSNSDCEETFNDSLQTPSYPSTGSSLETDGAEPSGKMLNRAGACNTETQARCSISQSQDIKSVIRDSLQTPEFLHELLQESSGWSADPLSSE